MAETGSTGSELRKTGTVGSWSLAERAAEQIDSFARVWGAALIGVLMPFNYLAFSAALMPEAPERWTRAYAICHFGFAAAVVGRGMFMWEYYKDIDAFYSNNPELLHLMTRGASGDTQGDTQRGAPLSAVEIQKWTLLLFLAGQMLRCVATSMLSPRVFWTSLRLMHLWQAMLYCGSVTLQWWAGLPIIIMNVTPAFEAAMMIIASQLACAVVFCPANRRRVARAIKRSASE